MHFESLESIGVSGTGSSSFDVQRAVERAKTEVYRRFPELDKVEPKYLARRIKSRPIISRYLIFRGEVSTDSGEELTQIVRVYLTPQGEIARIIASKSAMISKEEIPE